MKKTTNGVVTPIALICINKSRLKVYHKEKTPTYYLQKGQEFQIELFNPTSETVLAKICLLYTSPSPRDKRQFNFTRWSCT